MDQDNLNLNMFPGFSENLISFKPSPGDLFGYFESNEFAIYDNNQNAQNAEENFEDCYQKVFNPFLADNKKNILSEVNEINNVEDFIVLFQKQLDYYYYKKEFDTIIEIIEKRFPYFFNEKTNSFLFILQKLKFFELLRQDKLQEAKLFYKEKLLFLVKEIKKENWEKKNKFFMQLINNPKIILKRGDLQKKYYDQYSYELEKAIRNFLHDDNEIDDASSKEMHIMNNSISMSNSNLAFNHLFSSSSIDLDALIKNNNNNIEEEIEINTNKPKNEIKKEKSVDGEGKEDLDIENFSTKEEFSDFEDEIQQKCLDDQEKKDTNENTIDTSGLKFIDNNINNNSIDCEFKLVPNNDNRPDISSPFSPIPSKSFKSSFDDIDNNLINFDKNEFIINTSSKNIQKNFDEDKLAFADDISENALTLTTLEGDTSVTLSQGDARYIFQNITSTAENFKVTVGGTEKNLSDLIYSNNESDTTVTATSTVNVNVADASGTGIFYVSDSNPIDANFAVLGSTNVPTNYTQVGAAERTSSYNTSTNEYSDSSVYRSSNDYAQNISVTDNWSVTATSNDDTINIAGNNATISVGAVTAAVPLPPFHNKEQPFKSSMYHSFSSRG